MSDLIKNLPTDKIPLSKEENDMIDWLFPEKEEKKQIEKKEHIDQDKNSMTKSINKLKLFSVFIVFYILNMRKVDDLIEDSLKIKNKYIIPLIKTFLLFIIIVLVNKFI
jgi:hypothetical protein|tara:strand:+ start:480 stop:806 length:327 start_codon:yes stop_codon:yes gene_type:complete